MDNENTALIKELQDIFDNLKVCLQRRDAEMINTTIAAGERLLPCLPWKTAIAQFYSIVGNTYSGWFELYEYNNNAKTVALSDNLQKAKTYYRQALSWVKDQNPHLEKQVWVNYGNCLDFLGRGVEALYAYDEALGIDPQFAMAIGNKAITSRHFASISGSYTAAIHIDAYHALHSIIDHAELVAIGGQGAKQHFEEVLHSIEAHVTDKTVLEKRRPHPHYNETHLSDFEKFYLRFCITHKLFLNFHIHDDTCEAALHDSIFISITTPIDDTTTFFKLSRYINQIKEDYAVARLSLVQSQMRRKDFDSISKRTTFINPRDYSRTNIYTGLLKSAFKEAFNILDKIAVFLNRYYDLGLNERSISFDSVWVKDKKKDRTLRERLLHTENMSLYALYDIHKDFQNGYYQTLKEIRHALTHRQLTIFELGIEGMQQDGDLLSISDDEMLRQTIQLMRLVKAAIIYLINTVTIEEKKKFTTTGKVGTMSASTAQLEDSDEI